MRPGLPPKHRFSGRELSRRWDVNARHALYHREGAWWEVLEEFPGALFDPWGYVLFETEAEYRGSDWLKIGSKTNLTGDLGHLGEAPGYVQMEEGRWWHA